MLVTILLSALALPQADVPKLATAQAQLDHAKEVKKESRGAKGAARVAALDRACAAYGAVLQFWPDGGPVLAEAAFRQGEIHRSLDRPGQASGAFLLAAEHGAGTQFQPRGLLEIGHLHRRAAEFPDALKRYEQILALEESDPRYRNDAREWTGKIRLELEEWPAAAAVFRAWGDNAENPVELVKASDLEALAWIGAAQLEKARARIVEVESQVEELAAEPTKEAEALRKALDRRKAPGALAAAEEAARESGAPPAAGVG